jgi:hypothetical protein
MPQADPAERVVDRREAGADADALVQRGLELGERAVRARRDQPAQIALMRPQQRTAMAAKARRRGATGRAHPLQQLDRRRRAYRKPSRRLADRAPTLDRTHNPLPQIQGHWYRHDNIPLVFHRYCRIT